jgi:hypothetical protein
MPFARVLISSVRVSVNSGERCRCAKLSHWFMHAAAPACGPALGQRLIAIGLAKFVTCCCKGVWLPFTPSLLLRTHHVMVRPPVGSQAVASQQNMKEQRMRTHPHLPQTCCVSHMWRFGNADVAISSLVGGGASGPWRLRGACRYMYHYVSRPTCLAGTCKLISIILSLMTMYVLIGVRMIDCPSISLTSQLSSSGRERMPCFPASVSASPF